MNQMLFKRSKKGFTLIELIVVIAVIAILVLLASPKFMTYLSDARETRIRHDAKVAEQIVENYLATHNELPDSLLAADEADI